MNFDEYQEDLLVRYHHILGKRQSDQQKGRFIRALLIDLGNIRKDIQVIESKNASSKSVVSRNIYVGDVKNASKIMVTYYDTPMAHRGSYYFFDKQAQEKSTLSLSLILGICFLLLGIGFSLVYTMPILNQGNPAIWQLVIMVLVYFCLSWLIGGVAKGWPRRRNLIRNTSSILWMINNIKLSSHKDWAYAFVDNGTTNDHGLRSLMKSVKPSAKVYYLDSVGANAPLYYKKDKLINTLKSDDDCPSQNGLTVVFACNVEGELAFLSPDQLNAKKINEDNMQCLTKIFQ